MYTNRKISLDATQWKLLLLFLMVLDHIHEMFQFDGCAVPFWFTLLGRIVAPGFLFFLSESFCYTHSRCKMFLRCWAVAAGMGAAEFAMTYFGVLNRADGFYPDNGIFKNFVILFILWQGIDWLKERQTVKGLLALALPVGWNYLLPALLPYLPVAGRYTLIFLGFSPLPVMDWCRDGGMLFVLEGVVIYLLRDDRRVQGVGFALAHIGIYFFYWAYLCAEYYPDFTISQMFTDNANWNWMGVAIVPLLWLTYNGQRGKGMKQLFYIFYPTHVYLLFAISCMVYQIVA